MRTVAIFLGPILLQLAVFIPLYLFCAATGIPLWLPFAAFAILLVFKPSRPSNVARESKHHGRLLRAWLAAMRIAELGSSAR